MEKQAKSLHDDNNNNNNIDNNNSTNGNKDREEEEGLKRGGGGGGGDRTRRDEWSEGAVTSLLDAYEAKWVLRNRTKLKGQDWEDVARSVSWRADSTKSPKTMTQCKNKIESMKKRYRSESASTEPSSWPLFPRLHLLLRCGAPPPLPQTVAPAFIPLPTSPSPPQLPFMLLDPSPLPSAHPPPPPPPPPPPLTVAATFDTTSVRGGGGGGGGGDGDGDGENIRDSSAMNGVEAVAEVCEKENGVEGRILNKETNDIAIETDSSTPSCNGGEERPKHSNSKNKKKKKKKKKKRKSEDVNYNGTYERDLSESVRWLAEVFMRSEKARIETMREVTKIRAEAEAKKAEMDLKRTEIIAKTQLEIARLLVGKEEDVGSSIKVPRN